MEAKSVEDNGDGILFNVFCYNVQPSITIDYATGDSSESQAINESKNDSESVPVVNSSTDSNGTTDISNNVQTYVLNTNTKKFHYPTCSSVSRMSEKINRQYPKTEMILFHKDILHVEIAIRKIVLTKHQICGIIYIVKEINTKYRCGI